MNTFDELTLIEDRNMSCNVYWMNNNLEIHDVVTTMDHYNNTIAIGKMKG